MTIANDLKLYFSMAENNLAIKKEDHSEISLSGISFNKLILTCWFWAELKELWRVFHKSSSSMQERLLYCITLIARSLCLLIQFMSSQGPHFLLLIWSIFSLKKIYLVVLTIPLNFFQSVRFLDCLYALKSLQQFSFHQGLECLVILVFLEYLNYNLSMLLAKSWVIASRVLVLWIREVSIFLINVMSSSTNWDSLSLFLIKVCFFVWICSSRIRMLMEIGA